MDTAAASVKNVAFGDLSRELASTRRLLERLPDEHMAWKPHEKSMSLGALAMHLANLVFWQISTLEHDAFDLASVPRQSVPASLTREDVLATFDENVTRLEALMEQADDQTMGRPWTLRHGDHEVFTWPKAAVLRGMGLSHMIHHRGQLTVYLRLLDVPLPPLYGPTADEEMTW